MVGDGELRRVTDSQSRDKSFAEALRQNETPERHPRVRNPLVKAALLALVALLALASAAYFHLVRHCPAAGIPTSSSELRLNRLKNRVRPVPADRINRAVTLRAMLAPGDDRHRWRNDQGAVISGYVAGVWPGSPESANCFGLAARYRDTHLALALTPHAPRTAQVITEVTPRWRQRMRQHGMDWSQQALARLLGKRVRIRGWLMFDSEHAQDSRNTAPDNPRDWRATAWEVHPVTSLIRIAAPTSGFHAPSGSPAGRFTEEAAGPRRRPDTQAAGGGAPEPASPTVGLTYNGGQRVRRPLAVQPQEPSKHTPRPRGAASGNHKEEREP